MDCTAACKLIARTVYGDGDCLIRIVRGYPNRFGFAFQLLEPDFLDDQYIEFRGVPCNCPEELVLPDGRPYPLCQRGLHQVRMGVELHGDWMFPVAYWILADHPGDYFFGNQYNTRRARVPVSDMIHPFIFKRMGQTRGVPAMVAAMLRLQMLGGYDEATLVKARAAAQKIGLITKEIPDSIVDQFADQYEGNVPTMDCEPGGMLELPPGFKFTPWDPADPSPQYDQFTKRQTRMIAASGGVSYTSLSNDIENVNFSSIRSGLLEEREGWKGGQTLFVSDILRPLFEAWAPMAILSGQLDVPMTMVEAILDQEAACFQGRRWPWVDPEKDVAAELAAIDGGLKTRTDSIGERGGNFESTTAGLGREKRMRAAEGILPEPEAPAAGKPTVDEPAENSAADGAVKRDGWVTINGHPVHFGDDGKVDSGSGGLLQTAKQTARSAFADKAGEAAFAAGNAAHAAPTPASHTAAVGAHTAAAAAHLDAATSGPRATEHAGHAAMHEEKAEIHRHLAKTSAPKRQRRSFQLAFAPNGAQDVLDHIADQGGMASRKFAESRGRLAAGSSDYDDAPDFKGVYHHAVFGGSMKPDQMAQILHENHGVGDGSVGGMYSAIDHAVQTRKTVQKETKRQETEHKQGERFERDALTPHKGDKQVHVGNLAVGDVLTIHGQKVTVKDVDPDTMDVTLQDHSKYGAQKVQDGQVLYVEHVEQADGGHGGHGDGEPEFLRRRPDPAGNPAQQNRRRNPSGAASGTAAGGPAALETHGRKNPLSDSMIVDTPGAAGDVARETFSAINQVHDADQFKKTRFTDRFGAPYHEEASYTPTDGPEDKMDLADHASSPHLSVAHEAGHMVHRHAFKYATGAGTTSYDVDLRPYRDAIKKTASYKALQRTVRSHRGKTGEVSAHLRYLARPKEMFARDYSQYIALRSGHAKMLDQVKAERADQYQFGHLAYRSDTDMEKVAAGFDEVFKNIGWR